MHLRLNYEPNFTIYTTTAYFSHSCNGSCMGEISQNEKIHNLPSRWTHPFNIVQINYATSCAMIGCEPEKHGKCGLFTGSHRSGIKVHRLSGNFLVVARNKMKNRSPDACVQERDAEQAPKRDETCCAYFSRMSFSTWKMTRHLSEF